MQLHYYGTQRSTYLSQCIDGVTMIIFEQRSFLPCSYQITILLLKGLKQHNLVFHLLEVFRIKAKTAITLVYQPAHVIY